MTTAKPIPKGEHAITPYLNIKGADTAIQFYQTIFFFVDFQDLQSALGIRQGYGDLAIKTTRSQRAPRAQVRAPRGILVGDVRHCYIKPVSSLLMA